MKAGALHASGLRGVALQRRGACHTDELKRKRDFIVGEYRQDEAGRWRTEIPRRAPCAEGAGCLCEVVLHCYRERKTGPEHPLAVIRCLIHDLAFTIYSPGFVPYGRQRLPTCAEEIEAAPALLAVDDRADPEVPRWPDWLDPDGVQPAWASTQWRQIGRWGCWLGLLGPEALGQQVATSLGIPQHDHAAARERYRAGGDRGRSQAILAILAVVGKVGGVLLRLLRAGHLVGLCGRAFQADALGRLRRLVPF